MKEYIVQAFDSQNPIKLDPFYAEDVPEIVRCGECKYRAGAICDIDKKTSPSTKGLWVSSRWFCADGKRTGNLNK